MEGLKLERKTIKGSLQKVFKKIEEVDPNDEERIQRFLQQVIDKAERVFALNSSIKEIIFIEEEYSTEDISEEIENQENIRDEDCKYRSRCEFIIENIREMKIRETRDEKFKNPVKNYDLPMLKIENLAAMSKIGYIFGEIQED